MKQFKNVFVVGAIFLVSLTVTYLMDAKYIHSDPTVLTLIRGIMGITGAWLFGSHLVVTNEVQKLENGNGKSHAPVEPVKPTAPPIDPPTDPPTAIV